MSKIEKALKKAGEDRGNLQLVAAAATRGRRAPWTALLGQKIEPPRQQSEPPRQQSEPPRQQIKPLGQQIEPPETISRMADNEHKLLSADELRERRIIHPKQTREPAVQVFRELRTKINQQSRGQNAVILVAAVSRGNGASFIARNLAAAFAFDSAKTALLVDCNLRNPSVHQLLPGASLPGLADYFENPEIAVSKIIHRWIARDSGGVFRFHENAAADRILARALPRALHRPRRSPDVGHRRCPDPLRTVRLRAHRCAPRTRHERADRKRPERNQQQ